MDVRHVLIVRCARVWSGREDQAYTRYRECLMNDSNLITGTLARAFGSMWDFFAPVLVPFLIFAVVAFAVYVWRKFTNMG